MSAPWQRLNQQLLAAEMARVVQALPVVDKTVDRAGADVAGELDRLRRQLDRPDAVSSLQRRLGLSDFERDVLLLCAAANLRPDTVARLHAQHGSGDVTFRLALATLAEAHWSATLPDGPLRLWQLIGLGPGPRLVDRPLLLDEAILHYLTGNGYLADAIAQRRAPAPNKLFVTAAQAEIAQSLAAAWRAQDSAAAPPILELVSPDVSLAFGVAAAVADLIGWTLLPLQLDTDTPSPAELQLWARTARLQQQLLYLVPEQALTAAQCERLGQLVGPLVVTVSQGQAWGNRPVLSRTISPLSAMAQTALWREALGPLQASLNGSIDAVVNQFRLPVSGIAAIATRLQAEQTHLTDKERQRPLADRLWELCRQATTPTPSSLMRLIPPKAQPDDLILPADQRQLLDDLCVTVQQRLTVQETWGFANKSARGLGISALFSGPSGTGKTMAAEIVARQLNLPLYHIDLSQVINKYIGETEKHLRQIFDAAETGGAILLFDEADALFGKRSAVRDSHDRYANIEVSYLLQRIEQYRGLVILTSNLPQNLDQAFMRRLRFIIRFPFPDASARQQIWRTVFPAATPQQGLDVARLAQLTVPGGTIRNIALQGAVFAARDAEPVQMHHLLQAAKNEYAKLDRTLTRTETQGWGP